MLELNCWEQFGGWNKKLKICQQVLASSSHQQTRKFHVVERTGASAKCTNMKTKKHANLSRIRCRCHGDCWASIILLLLSNQSETYRVATRIRLIGFAVRLIGVTIRVTGTICNNMINFKIYIVITLTNTSWRPQNCRAVITVTWETLTTCQHKNAGFRLFTESTKTLVSVFLPKVRRH